jgi:hypothetical protein
MACPAQRTRLSLVALVLGLALLAPALATAAPRPAPRQVASAALSRGSLLGWFREVLESGWGGRDRSGSVGSTAGTTLQNLRGNAGCGIDPNGCPGW